MQPMINIALRAMRASSEQIRLMLDREELSLTAPQKVARIVERVNQNFYDDLSRALARAYPAHRIAPLGSLKADKGYSWHILPVNNPTGMVRHLGDWTLSVICKKDNQAEHALVIAPQSQEEYTASRGRGAALNGRRLRVSPLTELSLGVVGQNLSINDGNEAAHTQRIHNELNRVSFMLRTVHCQPLSLAQVAAGRLDAVVLSDYDQNENQAALLIAREAGALSSEFNGAPLSERSDEIICCNPKLLKVLLKQMKPE